MPLIVAPGSSTRSCCTVSLPVTSSVCDSVCMPCWRDATSEYVPGASPLTLYEPSAFVVAGPQLGPWKRTSTPSAGEPSRIVTVPCAAAPASPVHVPCTSLIAIVMSPASRLGTASGGMRQAVPESSTCAAASGAPLASTTVPDSDDSGELERHGAG